MAMMVYNVAMSNDFSPILGALVGDAAGVPYEFKRADQLPVGITFPPPASMQRSHAASDVGAWSDDGAQLLCLWESLHPGGIDLNAFAQRLLAWRWQGRHQWRGLVFDFGGTTAWALDRLRQGMPPEESGHTGERSQGNGSLMRNLAVGVAAARHGWRPEQIVDIAMRQSAVTHAHPAAMVTCAVHAVLVADLLMTPSDAASLPTRLPLVAATVRDLVADDRQRLFVDHLLRFGEKEICRGGGFVMDSFWSALHAVRAARSYREVIVKAISYGDDTDTTACIAGGLAGIWWEVDPVWLDLVLWPEESAAALGIFRRKMQ